jgi:hypothetical protein
MKTSRRVLALMFVMAVGSLVGKTPDQVLVFSSIHDNNYQQPTAEKPIYYMPLAGGFHTIGLEASATECDAATIAKEKVFAAMIKPLASQHYLPADKEHPATIILVAHWGSSRPDLQLVPSFNAEADAPVRQRFKTRADARMASQLVGGMRAMSGPLAYENARNNMADERYFLVLSAYDSAAFMNERRKVVLWRTRMSAVMNNKTTFTDSLEPLVTAGKSFFGSDSAFAREVNLTM